MKNIIVEFRDDDDAFKNEISRLDKRAYEQMPPFVFLFSRIGKEHYEETQLLGNDIETKTWTWFWDGEDESVQSADTITFVFNKKYEKEALEFKMRFG